MDDVGELPLGQTGAQVDKQARHGGDRNAFVGGDVLPREMVAAMRTHGQRYAPARRDNDIDKGGVIAPQLPENRGREVTERGPFARGEYSGEESGFERELAVPDGVHAAMHAMKDTARDALADCAAA